jgi:hypothetical protein
MLRRMLAMAFALGLLSFAAPARAQLHWDIAGQAGVMKRFLGARSIKGDAGFGPTIGLEGHVALLPLIRVGAYVGHDISPMPDQIAARDITSGGLHVKLLPPWPRGDFRLYFFLGFGYAGVYARSYPFTASIPTGISGGTTPSPGTVQGAGGSFFEIPFGIGATYKLASVVNLVGELGARWGFGHSGSVYEDPGPQLTIPGRPDDNVGPAGIDQWAVALTVGVMLDL